MGELDLIVMGLYAFALILLVLFAGRSASKEDYLCNGRSTGSLLLICSTVSTWIGSGAIIGVSAEAVRSGISYGLSVIAINVGVMLLFAFIAPRIKQFGDQQRAYTIGQFIAANYGVPCQVFFAVAYLGIIAIWIGSQLLAAGNLFSMLTGVEVSIGVGCAFLFTLFYSVIGGLKSDILSDFFQFWVMLLAFIIMIPLVFLREGGLSSLSNLPQDAFNPYNFGGKGFFFGSVLLGMIYPIVDGCNWQRTFSSRHSGVARRSFLFAAPLVAFFLISAIILGLSCRVLVPEAPAEKALFSLMAATLPDGIRGLAYTSIFALVMSTVDSLIVAGTACIACDLIPPITGKREVNELSLLRWLSGVVGVVSLALSYFFPSVVSLSILAAFGSLCFAPVILAALFGFRVGSKVALASMVFAVVAYIVGYRFLGNLNFVAILIGGLIPLVYERITKALGGDLPGNVQK